MTRDSRYSGSDHTTEFVPQSAGVGSANCIYRYLIYAYADSVERLFAYFGFYNRPGPKGPSFQGGRDRNRGESINCSRMSLEEPQGY